MMKWATAILLAIVGWLAVVVTGVALAGGLDDLWDAVRG